MSIYEMEELMRKWRNHTITKEQMIGQMILHAQRITQLVPEQADELKQLRRNELDAEEEVRLLRDVN